MFHARASGGIARYNWKMLLSGYAPAYVFDIGGLDTNLSFADLKQRSHINACAQAAGGAALLLAHPWWPALATTGQQVSDPARDDG